ncbi:MAG: hypothetical protein HGA90_02015 [Alphaproteobacteria bacterium]|nr:hypothetical protein [Alphaproteobacteria bacterium]
MTRLALYHDKNSSKSYVGLWLDGPQILRYAYSERTPKEMKPEAFKVVDFARFVLFATQVREKVIPSVVSPRYAEADLDLMAQFANQLPHHKQACDKTFVPLNPPAPCRRYDRRVCRPSVCAHAAL